MGLISLSYLNKIQTTNYWNNIWDSKFLYKKYLYLSLFINNYIRIILNEQSLNILINIIFNINLKKGYILNFFIKNKIYKNFLLGKIWILKYQNWYIIIIRLFDLNIDNNNLKIKKIKKIVNYKNNFYFFNNYMKYKNKF